MNRKIRALSDVLAAILFAGALLALGFWAATMPGATPERPTERETRGGR